MQKEKAMLIEEFVDSYMEKLFYFCLKKTGNSLEAEDLTQDIALQIITALNNGTIPTSFSGWIWSIARNRYSLWAKAKRRRNESFAISDVNDFEIEDESATTLDEMIQSEQLALLRRELAFIKSDYRKIVVAYYIEHKSIEEIASSLSLPENTVKSKLFRARKILKEGMEMAREFGKRSYNPDEITYTNICTRPGELGQPWTLLDPKLNQNIFLACYDTPMSPEELAIEVGVALPYIEDTLSNLTTQTLLVKNGEKYETSFPIISSAAQQKLHAYYESVIPLLISLISENIDGLIAQYDEAGLSYYGKYQSYEEAKWTLLPNFYKGLFSLCESAPKGKLGNTKRENNGVWDVVAFEKCDFTPETVGYHCQSNGFAHYRFGYRGIQNRTPANLSKAETNELYIMIANKKPNNIAIAEKLVEYGYAYKKDGEYIPRVSVISKNISDVYLKYCKKKKHSAQFDKNVERQKAIHEDLMRLFNDINQNAREILIEDLPKCISNNTTLVDALLGSILTTSHTLGYIVKHALKSGWLKYDENTSPTIGAHFVI